MVYGTVYWTNSIFSMENEKRERQEKGKEQIDKEGPERRQRDIKRERKTERQRDRERRYGRRQG